MQTTEDILAENSEDFTVTISSPTGGGGPAPSLGTSSSVTTTIRDNDALLLSPSNPSDVDIQLTVAPASVNEGDGKTTFTVTATHAAGSTRTDDTEITLSLGGTADSSDYTGPAQASVTIPANSNSGSGNLVLTLIDDDISEGDETIVVGGTSGELDIGPALITISDDESTYLSITGPAADVEEGSSASFTVTLSKAVAVAVTVAWSVATDTAVSADLGATTSGSVTFTANSAAGATQTITVAVTDDNLSEGSETFSVELGADTGDQADTVWVKSTAASATATIAQSDPITIELTGPASVDEGEVATYTVSISGGTPTVDLTVSYATADGTGEFGATAGEDYTATSGTLTFNSGGTGEQTVPVQTTQELLIEPDETFTMTMSSPSGGGAAPTIATGKATVTTTILTDDASSDPPENRQDLQDSVDIWLTVDPDSVNEGAGETTFTVTAEHNGDPQSDPVTIQLALEGTATLGNSGRLHRPGAGQRYHPGQLQEWDRDADPQYP